MANVSLNDGDISEFEKLANSLEFENKQYVKMIEKENQLISSLQNQIHENKEQTHRAETDISRLDEETMRLHKQFVHSKETLKNLKNTYNVMMDHEMALVKQLETLKIKSDDERQFYQEQMTNYSKIRDDYMKKYKSFPLAQELHKQEGRLTEVHRESAENENVIADLQQKIAEKEAVLDSKVMSRMVIKIARVKLSTIQIEKEVHDCLVEKTTLLEQLKEIQGTQDSHQIEDQKVNNLPESKEDCLMDCYDSSNDKNTDEDGPLTRYGMDDNDTNHPEIEKTDGFDCGTNNACVTSLTTGVEDEITEGKDSDMEPAPESFQQDNSNCDNSIDSHHERMVPDSRLHSSDSFRSSHFSQTLQNLKPTSSILRGKGPSNVTSQHAISSLSGGMNKIQTLPQQRALPRPFPRIPTFKPIEFFSKSKEISRQSQSAVTVPRAVAPRPTVPVFANKISLPALRVPKLPVSGGRATNTITPAKVVPASSKPAQTMETRKPLSTKTATNFSVPKLSEFSTPSSNYSAFCPKPLVQLNIPKIPSGGSSCQASVTSFNSTLKQNEKINDRRSYPKESQSNLDTLVSSIAVGNSEQKQQPEGKLDMEQSELGFTLSTSASADDIDEPGEPLLFKTASTADPLQSCQPSPKPVITTCSKVDELKNPDRQRFNLGSVFNPNDESVQSPTAFSLINLGSGTNNASQESTFLPFGNSSDTEDRPNSLLNLFNTPDKQLNSNPTSQFNIHFDSSGKDEEWGSFINFGKTNKTDDDDDNVAGGFFNFGKGFDKNDESEGKESFFKLF